jgi:hypothetical protein
MQRSYVFGTVQETRRTGIYGIRVKDDQIDPIEADEIAELMRKKMLSRGEVVADVVVVEGDTKETLQLYGASYSVSRVRSAMFNAAIRWQPIDL